ncbi:MAG: hypothetical protein R6V25_10590 [Desulfatiglandales bacterium]
MKEDSGVKEDTGVYGLEEIDFDPDSDLDPEETNKTLILRASAHWLWVAGKGPL